MAGNVKTLELSKKLGLGRTHIQAAILPSDPFIVEDIRRGVSNINSRWDVSYAPLASLCLIEKNLSEKMIWRSTNIIIQDFPQSM